MILFILFTLIAWVGTASLSKILYISIQQGQWLDQLLGWQGRLYKWDLAGKQLLAKAGGYCELCFSHALSFISFWCYLIFSFEVAHYWIAEPIDSLLLKILVSFLWYLIYVSVSTNLSLYFITKLFQR